MQKIRFIYCITGLFLLLATAANAQQLSNLRNKILPIATDTVKLDSLSIVPHSCFIFDAGNQIIPPADYELQTVSSLLILKNPALLNQQIQVYYRVFPSDFSATYQHKDTLLILPDFVRNQPRQRWQYRNTTTDIFDKNELERSGSISRGISFGNNQDVIVNSSLNLQLSGKLNENVSVLAAISDENIPIQPEGNSQQVQEFDKVFIKVFTSNTSLTVGDFEIERPPNSHFLNLYKKVQGARFAFNSENVAGNELDFSTNVSAAISKGRYNRMVFSGKEGNQGPYKLYGANNESYIIVLAATEKVYINGQLLQRGESNDYVMDYNMGEIRFTPNCPITKNSRIVVEFEYSERNYMRYSVLNSNELAWDKGKAWVNWYTEQDSKNQTVMQDLTAEHKQLLAEVGDSLQWAVVPAIQEADSVSSAMVLYAMRDTVVNGLRYDSVMVYATNRNETLYQVGFVKTGDNTGNYRQVVSSANGRVYQWIAPENGLPQGNYSAVKQLVAPQKKQMITAGAETVIGRNTQLLLEIAQSSNDINTFSGRHSGNNTGYALKGAVNKHFGATDSTGWQWQTELNYRFAGKHFESIERFREAEFERDWNITQIPGNENENWISAGLVSQYTQRFTGSYRFEALRYGSFYTATRHNVATSLNASKWKATLNSNITSGSDSASTSHFWRNQAGLSRSFRWFSSGFVYRQEYNKHMATATDSLENSSFRFDEVEWITQSTDSADFRFEISLKQRQDRLPFQNRLKKSSRSNDWQLLLENTRNQQHQSRLIVHYRQLQILDTAISHETAENTLTARLEYTGRIWKNALTMSTFYETGAGLEMKREFTYIEVAQGQGVYKWLDYNGNGVAELDEFEVANFQDEANYIKVAQPSETYIRTYHNQLAQSVDFQPRRLWAQATGWQKLTARFSNNLALRIETKNTDELKLFAFAENQLNDSVFVLVNRSLHNRFSFNRSASRFGADYIFKQSENRSLLVNGLDTKRSQNHVLQLRSRLWNSVQLTNESQTSVQEYISEYFSQKNYELTGISNKSSISYQLRLSWQFKFSYLFSEQQNLSGEKEKARQQEAGVEIQYAAAGKGTFLLESRYVHFQFSGQSNTAVAYTMLQGLSPGKNAVWTLTFQRRLIGNLQLNISYNGRVSENSDVVHTGNLQLRATF